MSEMIFRKDAYASECAATVTGVNDRGGIILDRTIFYPTGGGQPGDKGELELADGRRIVIATTVYDADKTEIIHVPDEGQPVPAPGAAVSARIEWRRRHRFMRVHTAMHVMCSVVPFAVTGGQIGEDGGRLDFNIDNPELVDKEQLSAAMNAIIGADHPVSTTTISDEELAANPGLVRTMSVNPPGGSGRVRLVGVGANGAVDLQPCGGTHVRSTAEIGPVRVTKIENKGKQNRRIRFVLEER